MNPRQHLDAYLERLRRRIRLHIYTRAFAVIAACVVLITCAAVWILQRQGFQSFGVVVGRAVLAAAVLAAAIALLWRPLARLRVRQGAPEFERRLPDQAGRLETYLDHKRRAADGVPSPLLDLLAEDAHQIAERTPPEHILTARHIGLYAAVAGVATLAAIVLLSLPQSPWGYGSRHLLLGAALPVEAVPIRRILVEPGDATVRRNSDLDVQAIVEGFDPKEAVLFVRFGDEQQWERAPMQMTAREGGAQRWAFKLYALRSTVSYYVAAEGLRSAEHRVAVVDAPRIERIRLTYHYPEWTGMEPVQDEASPDIRAVAGTRVGVEVFADGPLEDAQLEVNGVPAPLRAAGAASAGELAVTEPGKYSITARVANERVPLTDDYRIEILEDEAPSIEILRPGRDWRATSIEEVPVRVRAKDDFRVQRVELRYSVNGGEWQSLPLRSGDREITADTLLALEELGVSATPDGDRGSVAPLTPGDLVSYYAVAQDRSQSVQTDLFMVQVQPFERRFSQAQAGGGGGGMSDEQGAISERQREILLATWNLQRTGEQKSRPRAQLEENARMLAEMQTTLAQQARTLAERTRARVPVHSDDRARTFVEALEKAASLMLPAARHLSSLEFDQAVAPEQQALQQLLRAESAFRDVQVAMQQSGAGGGQQSARDFSEMFELEMDLDKNQYESESQLSMQQRREEMDEALRRLKELAQRQERLAQEANRNALPAQEQRWRQEQLRREAEDLRRQLAELARQENESATARNNERSQQGGRSGEQSGEAAGTGSGGREARQRGSQGQVANALEQLQRALDDMRAASGEPDGPREREHGSNDGSQAREGAAGGVADDRRSASARSAEQAVRSLRQAVEQLDRPRESQLADELEEFAARAGQLAERQRQVEQDLHDALSETPMSRFGARGADIDRERAQALTEAKQAMAGEVADLQRRMREAINAHRHDQPESTNRLGQVIGDLEAANLALRLNRSAAEIMYGRAREAAPREGIITSVLEQLEEGLRETARVAAAENDRRRNDVRAEQLLAELGELRRAVEAAGHRGARGDEDPAGQQDGERTADRRARSDDRAADSGASGRGQEGDSQSSASLAEAQGATPSENGAREGVFGGASGLTAWNPGARVGPLRDPQVPRHGWSDDPAQISERVRDLLDRLSASELPPADIEALRRLARPLRGLNPRSLAEQHAEMRKVIDQLELATLAALEKSRAQAPAHTAIPSPESPQYREAIAEYYRRLGGGT